MDPNRHHDFLSNNEDRSRAAYYGREMPEITSHHYYAPATTTTRTVSNTRKPCGCTTTGSATTAGTIMCNGCRLQPPPPDDGWPPTMAPNNQMVDHTQRAGGGGGLGDYGRMAAETTQRSNMRQSPMFLQQQQHHQSQQQQQQSHLPPPSMVQPQQHVVGNMGNRSNYWSHTNSTTQPYNEDHMGGIPEQPQIDISVSRRPAPPVPMDTSYGQYKPAPSVTATHSSHTGSSSYPTLPSSTSTNSLHHRSSSIGASGTNPATNAYMTKERIYEQHQQQQKYSSSLVSTGKMAYNSNSPAANINSSIYDSHPQQMQQQQQHHLQQQQQHHHMMNNQTMTKTQTIDHHVINPSNMPPASKEQHPSPNYARKCPQMYAPEEQTTAHHHHLYMSTPQFSSDKFTRASPQQPPPPQQQQQPLPPDFTKLRESPQGNSYMHPAAATNDKYNHSLVAPPPSHLRESPQFPVQQSTLTRNNPSANSYYTSSASSLSTSSNQNPSKILPPEMSPIIMKQTHTHYQYSKSPLQPLPPPAPLPPSTHHLHSQSQQHPHQQPSLIAPPPPLPSTQQMTAKLSQAHTTNTTLGPPPPATSSSQLGVSPVHHSQRYLMDNVKREDLEIYENPNVATLTSSRSSVGSSGIYINPYNTPPPTGDNCCSKDVALSNSSSPYTTGSATPNYRVESPQFYPTKYGKLAMTEMSVNSNSSPKQQQHTSSLINQNTPPPSRAPSSQRGGQHPANYNYYEGNPHSAPSPAAATAASPSPSSLMTTTTSQTQMHHTEYVTTLQGGPPPIAPLPPAAPPHMGLQHNMQQTYPTQATSAQHSHQHHHQQQMQQQQTLTASLRNNDVTIIPQKPSQPYERTTMHPQHHQSLAQQQMTSKHIIPQAPPLPHPNSSSLQHIQQQQQGMLTHSSSAAAASNKPNLAKHQKPNYRELINQKLAMRNATSEEELNLQIIKKTLNVDSPNVRNSPNHNSSTPSAAANRSAMQHSLINERLPNMRDPLRTTDANINSSLKGPSASVLITNSAAVASSPMPSTSRLIDVAPPLIEAPRVRIKQEDDKPSSSTSATTSSSPLDLSMRTVKTKADSTEYKYQQRQRLPNNLPTSSTAERSEGRYTLPRVDSTPIFSVHAFEPAAAAANSNRPPQVNTNHSRHNSLDTRNYTPPTQTPPSTSNMGGIGSNYNHMTSPHIPASPSSSSSSSASLLQQNYSSSRRNDVSPLPPKAPSSHSIQNYEKSMVIKTAPKPSALSHHQTDVNMRSLPLNTSQTRPSVLESNPYATVIKTEPKRMMESIEPTPPQPVLIQNPLAAVDRLPPDTSIMALPPRNAFASQRPLGLNTNNSSSSVLSKTTPPSNYSLACEKNPNFLGRKRHLQDYAHQMSASQEPVAKQNRYMDLGAHNKLGTSSTTATKTPIPMRPADISVIAVNDVKPLEMERNSFNINPPVKQNDIKPFASVNLDVKPLTNATNVIVNNYQQLSKNSSSSLSSEALVVCKQEPLTPTADNPLIKLPEATTTTQQYNNQQINSSNSSSTSSFSARIRTKAELKGFTFNLPPPPPLQITPAEVKKPSAAPEEVKIKQEEDISEVKIKEEILPPPPTPTVMMEVAQIEMPSIPGLDDVYEERSLLDFGWSNTCNNLVEQLLTRPAPKKKVVANKTPIKETSTAINKTPIKETSPVLNKTPPTKETSQEMVVSSTDVAQQPLLSVKKDNTFSNMESADNTTRSSFARIDAGLESSLTFNTFNQDSSQNSNLIHKKLTKADREKKRFQQEKRLAERLKAKESSSETEDELDKRKTERLKKPAMKSKHKVKSPTSTKEQQSNNSSNSLTDKNRFSECGSDSTATEENAATKTNKTSPQKMEIKQEKLEKEEEKVEKKEEIKSQKIKENCDKTIKEEGKMEDKKKVEVDKTKKSAIPAINQNKVQQKLKKDLTPNKQETKKLKETKPATETECEEEDEDDEEEEEQEEDKPKAGKNKIKGKFTKQALNTMTRSKRKKELELQLANSKVLRNDKIIRNSSNTTTNNNSSSNKIIKKYTRKYNNVNSLLESGGLSRESGVMKSTRLKAKLERNGGKLNLLKNNKNKPNNLANKKEALNAAANKLKNCKNPENVHERNVIDLYRFKRALKVPPSLIHIKHPGAHKIAASLPDLERHAEALEAKKQKKNILKSKAKLKCEATASSTSTSNAIKKGGKQEPEEPKSIIDLLHSRVTKSSGLNVRNKTTTTIAVRATKPCCSTTTSSNNTNSKPPLANSSTSNSTSTTTTNNCALFSETSQTTESSELQMLPELKKDSEMEEDLENDADGKKRHFSIFDTQVLPTKTRTESKLQQKKENIREIFVGDDRPASAPPEMTQSSDCSVEKMTYEQKYEQFLQQMNIVISGDKFNRFGKSAAAKKLLPPLGSTGTGDSNIKQEEVDTESTSVIDADELKTDALGGGAGGNHIRKKRGKYLRRKGSSGFDYIRKKKKPTPASSTSNSNLNNGPLSNLQCSIKTEKLDNDEYVYKIKTEDDVSREIQKWVLNKGVGQSTMHKAARQGYIDVIVYCLDRMGMNPDQKDNAGYTPLHEACTNGWLNIARVLLQYGANHSEAAHSGIRPLHEASENDHEEIVRLLLSYGADPLLATYSGQTPLMLASSKTMRDILNNHLIDVQSMGPERKPWKFNGPWEIYDPTECGYNVFEGAPNSICDMSRALLRKTSLTNNQMFQNIKKQQKVVNSNSTTTTTTTAAAAATADTPSTSSSSSASSSAMATTSNNLSSNTSCNNSNTINVSGAEHPSSSCNPTTSSGSSSNFINTTCSGAAGVDASQQQLQQQTKGETTTKTVMDKCAVVLDNIDRFNSVHVNNDDDNKPEILVENSDSDGEMFEFEEADILLPPLYLLKDEGTQDKWVLLNDLCNLLKVKSKDTLLNKIYPSTSSSVQPAHKSLMRELKMSDFLEKATCLQLLCAGEKLNICASKVVLIKYNESVRNLLGVKTILMKF